MADPIRVLQVYPQMNNAGTERVILNLYENIDRNCVQFDFLVEKKGELDEKIRNMGGKIFYLYNEKRKTYYNALTGFFADHPEYSIVHTHTHARMGIVLKAAKKANVACRIAHSHNSRNDLSRIAGFIKGISSIPIERNANFFFACSQNAAKWLFPYRVKECTILFNGIDLKRYLYNSEIRKKKRKALNIQDEEILFIHVGRFAKQKNHEFLINVMSEYNKKSKSWKLLLVGTGPLQDGVKKQVSSLGLQKKIMFLGSRNDVDELMSASDCFIFPSRHEGLGIVVIEAQASSLPCIVSDAVPPEAELYVGLLTRLNLKDDYVTWADKVDLAVRNQIDRELFRDMILESKYNIETIGKEMQSFYLSHAER